MSTQSRLGNELRSTARRLITVPARIFSQTSLRQKFIYGSAAMLTLFIAPAATASFNPDEQPVINSEVTSQTSAEVPAPAEPAKEQATNKSETSQSTPGNSTSVTNNNGEVKVMINGQDVPVPKNGTVKHQTSDGTTTIQTETQSSGGNSFNSTTTFSNSTSTTINNNQTNFQNQNTYSSNP